MSVANSFDLWQKDTFFSAAEEVQQSADVTWLRATKEGLLPHYLDELARELQMALGTAKWQLEEFEKAVRLSYRNNGDDIRITRHKQFVSAIEDQVTLVEKALKESFDVEGKKPFRWVNLDDDEYDDLALFLSGSPETSQTIKDKEINNKSSTTIEKCILDPEVRPKMQIPNLEIVTSNENESRFLESRNEFNYQDDRNQRRALEIIIDSDDGQMNALIEAMPKEKGSKPFFWGSRGEDHLGAKGVIERTQFKIIGWLNQHMRQGHRSQSQQQISPVMPFNSIRFVLGLILTIFLVVPFLLYST